MTLRDLIYEIAEIHLSGPEELDFEIELFKNDFCMESRLVLKTVDYKNQLVVVKEIE